MKKIFRFLYTYDKKRQYKVQIFLRKLNKYPIYSQGEWGSKELFVCLLFVFYILQ